MNPSRRNPVTGRLLDKLAPLIALWLLLSGSAVAIAGTGKPPTQPRLSPSGVRLTDCSVQVPTNFKAEWSWTDGAILGMVELWETSGKGGRQTRLIKKRDQAKAAEVSATLDKNSWYRLKVRNYTANADVWLDVDFTTGLGLVPQVSLNTTAIETCAGSPFELVANINGCNTSVQWYFDGKAISGATTSTLRRNASLEDSGDFMVVVCNPAGKRSATCNVDVLPGVHIVTQPESQEVEVGDPIELSVEAEGESLQYQWYKNGAPIPGANQPEFTIPVARTEDTGSYTVSVSGRCGKAGSEPANVTVTIPKPPLTVRILPMANDHCQGEPIQLVAEIVGEGWKCQWYHNDSPIPNATSPTLQFQVSEATAGNYTIKVSSPTEAEEDSQEIVALPNVTIQQQPEPIRVEIGETIELSVVATGETDTHPLTYQWFKNTLAIPGATDDTLSITNAQPADAGSYSVVVSGQCGSVRSAETLVTVDSPIDFAEEPPAMTYLHVGQTLRLVTRASNATEYQWYYSKDGLSSVAVAGAKQAALTKEQASSAQSGVYWVVASNSQGGNAQSSDAVVEVLEPLSATISSKAGTNSILQLQFSIRGLPQEAEGLKPLSLILLVDGRQILATNQPANQSRGTLTTQVDLTPGTHRATLLIEDFLGAKLKVTTPIETATTPEPEQPMVRFQRTPAGLLISWRKEFVLGEEAGQWQLVGSLDLEEWYPAFYEEDEPKDLGTYWGVTVLWIDADENLDEAGSGSGTQEPVSEFFRLTPWKPEVEITE